MTTHLMLDIETLGTRPGAVVLSAALVRFSDLASTSVNFGTADQTAVGLNVDPQTWTWWQLPERTDAWSALCINPLPLVPALQHIAAWIAWATASQEFLIWCHGASFDAPILGEVFRRAGLATPWPFWAIRDTRTLYDLAGVSVVQEGTPHIALNDAMVQTRAAIRALEVLAPRVQQ